MRDLGYQDQFYLLVILIKNIAYMIFFLSDWESSGDEGYKNIRETERKTDGWRNRGKKEKLRSFVFRKRKRELG